MKDETEKASGPKRKHARTHLIPAASSLSSFRFHLSSFPLVICPWGYRLPLNFPGSVLELPEKAAPVALMAGGAHPFRDDAEHQRVPVAVEMRGRELLS